MSSITTSNASSIKPPSLIGLAIGMAIPTLVTWVYFESLSSQASAWQQAAYAIGKTLQFLFPLLFFRAVREGFRFSNSAGTGERGSIQPRYARSLWLGIASGLSIAILIICLYYGVFKPYGLMDGPAAEARKKLLELGLNDPWKLAAVAVFYSLIHAGLEEYYWRWFVFGGMSQRTGFATAAIVSSLGFMAHHVILLARYFGWTSPLTFLFAIGVAVGGVIWAALYRSTRTVAGSWLSHSLVDAAIFIVAFDLTKAA